MGHVSMPIELEAATDDCPQRVLTWLDESPLVIPGLPEWRVLQALLLLPSVTTSLLMQGGICYCALRQALNLLTFSEPKAN
eukprot:3224878-Amphidinium_carterae.1